MKALANAVSDTYIIMYKAYRTFRPSDPPSKAAKYAEDFPAYLVATLVFDVVLVPAGLLMAYRGIPFTVTRYTLMACMIVSIVVCKRRTDVVIKALETDDRILLDRFSAMSLSRWVVWSLYLLVSICCAIALGSYYSVVARLR